MSFRQRLINFTGKRVKKFSDETFQTYDRISNEHPKFTFIGLLLFYLVTISLIIKLIYITGRHLHKFPEISEFEHIDLAGLLCGMLGINIAFLITMYVEKNHNAENQSLKIATDDIIKKTNELLVRYNSLMPLKDLSERMDALSEIIEITKKSQLNRDKEMHNSMYILNYNASYGLLQSFNAKITVVEGEGRPANLRSWAEYYSEIQAHYANKEDDNFKELSNLKEGSVNVALLRTKVGNNKNQVDKYERLLKKVLNNSEHRVLPYYKYDYSQDSFRLYDIIGKENEEGDIYTLSFDSEEDLEKHIQDKKEGQKKLKEKLIEKLILENKIKVEALSTRVAKNKIAYMDYVPFQFFLTIPDNKEKSTIQKCLIIFTNILSIEEYKSKTVSFKSDNPQLIQTLKEIHLTLTNSYKNKEIEKNNLLKLFNCVNSEPCFVIKNLPDIEWHEQENAPLTYLSDYSAYTNLKELFFDYEIVNTKVRFDVDFDKELKPKNPNDRNKTFIVIGLFKNKVSDIINLMKNEEGSSCFRSFFFSRPEIKNNKHVDETIKVANYVSDINGDIEREENWNVSKRKKKDELALFAKIEKDGSTYIICGGLNSYGTEIIGKYIRENFKKMVGEIIGENNLTAKSFAIVFRMPLKENVENPFEAITDEIVVEKKFFLNS